MSPKEPSANRRRVQAQGIHLKRLVYLTEEEFKFLKLLRERFLKRTRRFFKKAPRANSVAKKQALQCPTKEDLKPRIDNHTPCYEPTNIMATRDSEFWSWMRVKEYDRYIFQEENMETGIQQVRELIYS